MATTVKSSVPRGGRLRVMFRALAHRNYRLFWAGAFLSSTGTWMQVVAQAILVYQLTRSPFWLGLDTFMATLPGLLLTLFGGALADLVDRKKLLLWMQVGAGAAALLLAALVAAGVVGDGRGVLIVLALSFVTGCCMAIAGPSYQAITVDLVGREDVANAIALNSMQFQLSRVIGPALAGAVISLFGVAGCFLANGLSYVAIVAALARVRYERPGLNGAGAGADPAPAPRAAKGARSLWRDLVAGFGYVGKRPRVRLLLLCSSVVSLFGAPYLVLIPVFANEVFGWGDGGVSLMMGTAGAGAFCGALLLAYLGDFRRKGWFVLGSSFSASLCVMGFAWAAAPALSLVLLFGVGFSMVCFFAVCNTLLQYLVTDEMRGRVMSMWILTFIGTMPFGSFIAGAAAERFGAPHTLGVGGAVITLFVLFLGWRNPRLREI